MKSLFLSLVVLVASPVWADVFFVEPAEGNGVSTEDAMSTTELVRQTVSQLGHELTRIPDEAKLFLVPRVMKLGDSVILTVRKETSEGKLLFSSKLKANRIEELDLVAERVTRSAINEVSPEKDLRVSEVTETESKKGSFRKPALAGKYFGLGPAWLSQLNSGDMGFYFSAGYAWDVNFAMVRLSGDFVYSSGAFFSDVSLGLNYFFLDTPVSPFLGADFGVGFARVNQGGIFNHETVTGFMVGATGGIQLLRATSINLELAVKVSVILNSARLGNPLMTGLRLGLYF